MLLRIWRVLYPVLMHFAVTQLVGGAVLLYWTSRYENGLDIYYQNAIALIGITGILTMIPAFFFYRSDRRRRIFCGVIPLHMDRLRVRDGALLLGVGAALAMYGNIFMAICQIFLQSTAYQESLEQISQGKGLFMMILWMGLVAPVAEEFIFRWLVFLRLRDYMRLPAAAVISGLIFGIYHGNILQAIYASLLGMMFAWFLEKTGNLWSCILLHIGANVWSLVYPVLLADSSGEIYIYPYLAVLVLFMVILCVGISYFSRRGKERNKRLI